jgi:hypothetical protein
MCNYIKYEKIQIQCAIENLIHATEKSDENKGNTNGDQNIKNATKN